MAASPDIKAFCGIINLFPSTKHPFSIELMEDKLAVIDG